MPRRTAPGPRSGRARDLARARNRRRADRNAHHRGTQGLLRIRDHLHRPGRARLGPRHGRERGRIRGAFRLAPDGTARPAQAALGAAQPLRSALDDDPGRAHARRQRPQHDRGGMHRGLGDAPGARAGRAIRQAGHRGLPRRGVAAANARGPPRRGHQHPCHRRGSRAGAGGRERSARHRLAIAERRQRRCRGLRHRGRTVPGNRHVGRGLWPRIHRPGAQADEFVTVPQLQMCLDMLHGLAGQLGARSG